MIIIVAALADTIEITATTYQFYLIRELVGKTLLHIEGLSTINMEDVGFCIERTGNLLWKGVKEAVDKEGFIGIFMGGFKASAVGISAALIFGYLASLVFEPKMKK